MRVYTCIQCGADGCVCDLRHAYVCLIFARIEVHGVHEAFIM